MKYYLFEIISGDYEGEQFIVGADTFCEAETTALDIGGDERVQYICELTEYEAENSGLDEY